MVESSAACLMRSGYSRRTNIGKEDGQHAHQQAGTRNGAVIRKPGNQQRGRRRKAPWLSGHLWWCCDLASLICVYNPFQSGSFGKVLEPPVRQVARARGTDFIHDGTLHAVYARKCVSLL